MGTFVMHKTIGDEDDVHITVEYDYHKAHRGKRDSFNGRAGAGIQLEPDENADVEIKSMSVAGVELNDVDFCRLLKDAEEKAWEDLGDDDPEDYEDEGDVW